MDGGAESTLGMTQLRSYLNWALEQIESDVTALDTSISASNEQTAPDSDSNIRKMPTAE